MSGALRTDWRPLSLRELVVRYESHLLTTWDHTTLIQSSLENLYCLVNNAANSFKDRPPRPQQPRSFLELHPYRENAKTTTRSGDSMTLKTDNLHVLKGLFAQKRK